MHPVEAIADTANQLQAIITCFYLWRRIRVLVTCGKPNFVFGTVGWATGKACGL